MAQVYPSGVPLFQDRQVPQPFDKEVSKLGGGITFNYRYVKIFIITPQVAKQGVK